MKHIVLILFVLISACSVQSKLSKTFTGKNLSTVEQELGMKATSIFETDDGFKKVIFVKEEALRSMPIGQGEGTLDPMTSPAVTKTERFIFILNKDGNVVDCNYEKSYERL